MKKKHIIILSVLASLFVILLTLSLLGKFVWGWFDDQSQNDYVPPTLEEGEAYYYIGSSQIKDVVLMYPQITREDLAQVRVHNSLGDNYFFYHTMIGDYNYFSLGECDSDDWDWTADDLYYPSILDSFVGAFDYTSLYDDTSTLPAMLAAVGTVMIDERIKPQEGEWGEEFLARYGLSKADDPAYFELVMFLRDGMGNYIYASTIEGEDRYIGFNSEDGKYYYIDGDNKTEYTQGKDTLTPAVDTTKTVRVYVGQQTIDDTGYYLYLEGRNVIYTVQGGYLSDVVGRNMGYYVAPQLVTQAESVYANQLAPYVSIENGQVSYHTSTIIDALMSVGFTSNEIWKVDSDNTTAGWYSKTNGEFSLIDLKDSKTSQAFLSALVGKHVGDTVDILVSTPNLSQIGKTETCYINCVEGVITSNGYDTTEGYQVQAGDKIIVRYVNGRTDSDGGFTSIPGYIDLGDSRLTQAHLDTLIGLKVGEKYTIEDRVILEFTYNESAPMYNIQIQLESIDSVMNKDGESQSTITYGSIVTMTYVFVEDGEKVGEYTNTLMIPEEADMDVDDEWVEMGYDKSQIYTLRQFYKSILGKAVGSYLDGEGNSTFGVTISYPQEVISDFIMYRDGKIEFVTSYEEIVSFGHTNDRNVYHGSSAYTIYSPDDKTLYGIDSNSVMHVLQYFEDLAGNETVALGIDTETMREYGLFAYKLTYELPFDCYTSTTDDGRTLFHHKSSITFHLYISEKAEDGSRYVGSDQYDLVAKVDDGSIFDFMEWDFYSRWMQNSLLMLSYEDLRGMVFDLNFTEEEYNHLWGFEINVDRNYPSKASDGTIEYVSKLYASLVDGGEGTGNMTYEEMRAIFEYDYYVNGDDYSKIPYESQLHISANRYIQTISDTLRNVYDLKNGTDLDAIYGYQNAYGAREGDGTYSLRKILYLLNVIYYYGEAADELTDAEKEEIMAGEYTMALGLTLCDESGKEYGYTLRFYNYSGHSLVSITDERNGTSTSLFYIQSRDVMKLAKMIVDVTQGKLVDIDGN